MSRMMKGKVLARALTRIRRERSKLLNALNRMDEQAEGADSSYEEKIQRAKDYNLIFDYINGNSKE